MDLIITILPVVTKDLPISPRFKTFIFLSRCKFSTLTTRQPMVEFYLLTFPRCPLRKKEHKSYFGKDRTHDFRTSRCAAYLLDHSGYGPTNMCLSFPTSTIGMKWACWKYLDESDSRSFPEEARVRLTYLSHVWYFNSLPISAYLYYSNEAKVSSASLSKRSEAAIEEWIKGRLRGYVTKENLPKTSTITATIRPSPGGDRSPIHASTL